jgi:hypothetical protein
MTEGVGLAKLKMQATKAGSPKHKAMTSNPARNRVKGIGSGIHSRVDYVYYIFNPM